VYLAVAVVFEFASCDSINHHLRDLAADVLNLVFREHGPFFKPLIATPLHSLGEFLLLRLVAHFRKPSARSHSARSFQKSLCLESLANKLADKISRGTIFSRRRVRSTLVGGTLIRIKS
jgi:hypothetical protein